MRNFYLLLFMGLLSVNLSAQCPVNISGSTNICSGQTTTLTASSTATSYTWNPGGVNSATVALSPTVSTTYTVIGTDGICTDSATVTVFVTQTPTLSASAGSYNICQGQMTGVGVTGATSYTWMPGGVTSFSMAVAPNATTTYTVCGSTAGCVSCTTLVIVVNPAPTLSVGVSNSICGMCNGSAWAMCGGGTGPYTFTWSPMGATTSTISNLCAGAYTCTVSDGNGCIANNAGFVSAASITNIYTSVVPSACGQANGSITVDSLQGPQMNGYSYNLNGGSYTFNTTFNNLSAGFYTVGAKDSSGTCTYTVSVTVNDSNFHTQLNPTVPGCNLCNGALSTTITGGTGPYTYTWSTGSNSSSVSGLCAGNYQVLITDNIGCFTSAYTSLISPAAPVITVDSIKNIHCLGVDTGRAYISVTGGVPSYTYSWNTNPVQTTSYAKVLNPGMYTVQVTDNSGCISKKGIYIGNSSNIYVYPGSLIASNCGATGSGGVNVYGGLAPYTFNWNSGQTTQYVNNLPAGNYTVTATDANGCSGSGQLNIQNVCVNIIKGRIYSDANQNCIQDMGEGPVAGRTVIATPGSSYAITDANGDYILQTTQMAVTVTAYANQQSYLTPTCPPTSTLSVSFSQAGDTLSGNDFGYWANPAYVDLNIHPGFSGGNPGISKTYWILFGNSSPTPQNVLIRFTYDPALQFDSARAPGIHYPAQHKIEWTFNNVAPNTGWNWQTNPYAYFKVPSSVPITSTLTSLFEILPVAGDVTPYDNTVNTTDPVTGSRDPNSKTCHEPMLITQDDSLLHYTVHFQNNGNDTAYRVVVVDTLSPLVEPGTIIPGAASHPYTFNLSGQGICTWTFDSIMLPDSLTNEPASNGYFTYSVRQKTGNPLGFIFNTAYIYFDFNSAVVTNTTDNEIVVFDVPEITAAANSSQLIVYPNPTNGNFTLMYELKEDSRVSFEISNILGEQVRTIATMNKQKGNHAEEINTSGLPNGIYIVKMLNGNSQRTQKIIIQK